MPTEYAVVKCSGCGADMVFSPDKCALECPYCKQIRNIDKKIPFIRDYLMEVSDAAVVDDAVVFSCPNCGADIEMTSFTTAAECPFCKATNILKKENMPGIAPDSILPFAVSKDRAVESGKKWLKRKIFAPSAIKKQIAKDGLKGIYVPVFSFYANTRSSYEGRFGEIKTRVVGSGKNRRVETYTQWYSVRGNFDKNFSDVAIEASCHLEQTELDKIMPFDMQSAERYNREYIAGFSAERYNTSLDVGYGVAKGKMEADIRQSVINKYHPDKVDYLNVYSSFSNIKFRYSVAPVWLYAYKFKEKIFRLLINGRTGKTAGKVPTSGVRVSLTVFFALGIAALLVWLFVFSGIIDFI